MEALFYLFLPLILFPMPMPLGAQDQMHLFVLAGQSNMSGRGEVPQNQTLLNDHIWVFGNDYQWKLAQEPIDDWRNQRDLISQDVGAGVGPGLAFAQALHAAHPDWIVGLIPCAYGGSALSEWQQGKPLYESCLQRVQEAQQVGRIRGLLFFQGETDAIPQEWMEREIHADDWHIYFERFVNDFREDTGEMTPVIFAQLGPATDLAYINLEVVRTSQARVDIIDSYMVHVDDIPFQSDGVHYTTAGYIEIGRRFAAAYLGN